MFITMPAGLPDGVPDRVIFTWGWGSSSPLHRWLMVIMMLSNVKKEGLICTSMPLLPKAFLFEPHIECQKCYTVGDHSTAPWYTGVIPATCAGLASWVLAWVSWAGGYLCTERQLREGPLLMWLHLLTV